MMVIETLRKQIEIACEQRDAAWAAIDRLRRELMLAREWREALEEVARRHREAEDECERLREANRVGRDHLRELDARVRRETDILRAQNEALMKIATTRQHYVVINPRPEPDKTAYFWLGREADRG